MKYKIIFTFLVVLILTYPFTVIFQNQNIYFSKGYESRYDSLKSAYGSSQYADKNHKGVMLDEALESFAGGIFLKGINPVLIHHDQPPMGRYIIALSILLFDNEKTIPLFLLFISALGIYLVSRLVIKNKYLALIPLGIFINQPMFIHKLTFIPLLEPIQLPFIIFAIYTFIIGVKKKNYIPWFIITAILIGFVISIRYFVLGAALTSSFFLYLLLQKKFRMLLSLGFSLAFSLIVLLLSYFQTFHAGYSLIKVLGIQKYILVYHKSAFTQTFSYWDLLLFNRWHTWWGNYSISSDPEWSILWPISVLIILAFLFFVLRNNIKLNSADLILLLWIGVYSVMLSVGYTSTRYFLPLIPFIYILATSFMVRLINYFFTNHHRKVSPSSTRRV